MPVVHECDKCGGEYSRDQLTLRDGERYCDACFEECFFTCEQCGAVREADEARETDNGNVCEACFDRYYFSCSHCGDVGHVDDRRVGADDEYYCESCFDDRFVYCGECDCCIDRDDAIYSDEEDCYYCSSCYEDRQGEEDGSHVIHDHDFTPRDLSQRFSKLAFENTIYYGLELEVLTSHAVNDAKDLREYLETLGVADKFYFKWDGSVEGFEIVSVPMTLKYIHKYVKLYKILNWLKRKGLRSYTGGQCGLHVHVSKSALSLNNIRTQSKLKLFFANNYGELKRFSMRTQARLEQWARIESFTLAEYKRPRRADTRYVAVNVNNTHGTIEFRLFRGTLNFRRVLATLQLVDAIVHYVNDVGFMSLSRPCFAEFYKWSKSKSRYTHLTNYLQKRGDFSYVLNNCETERR